MAFPGFEENIPTNIVWKSVNYLNENLQLLFHHENILKSKDFVIITQF